MIGQIAWTMTPFEIWFCQNNWQMNDDYCSNLWNSDRIRDHYVRRQASECLSVVVWRTLTKGLVRSYILVLVLAI